MSQVRSSNKIIKVNVPFTEFACSRGEDSQLTADAEGEATVPSVVMKSVFVLPPREGELKALLGESPIVDELR